MNRRRLLAMLPLAPIVALLPAAQVVAETKPIDSRSTFRRSEYALWHPGTPYTCETHLIDHGAYTHGCSPVAFPIASTIVPGASARPVTVDAIPLAAYRGCPFSGDLSGSHQHHDFQWID